MIDLRLYQRRNRCFSFLIRVRFLNGFLAGMMGNVYLCFAKSLKDGLDEQPIGK